jgi:hypothetical protein
MINAIVLWMEAVAAAQSSIYDYCVPEPRVAAFTRYCASMTTIKSPDVHFAMIS